MLVMQSMGIQLTLVEAAVELVGVEEQAPPQVQPLVPDSHSRCLPFPEDCGLVLW